MIRRKKIAKRNRQREVVQKEADTKELERQLRARLRKRRKLLKEYQDQRNREFSDNYHKILIEGVEIDNSNKQQLQADVCVKKRTVLNDY